VRRHRSGCRPGPRRACRPQAFTPLYRKYVDPVYRYCYRRVSDPDRAADLTASIFTRALESLPRLQVGDAGGTFRSWLFTIAHNAVVDSHRQHRITAELPLDRQDPSPGPEDRAVHRDEFDRLLAVLDRLPEQHRQIIELRLAGLTSAEIANVLSVSKAAVKSAQTRAYARLRELLAAPDTEFPGGRS
jgi:RNA polymerase sigma-70 factor (ECF subfamily)